MPRNMTIVVAVPVVALMLSACVSQSKYDDKLHGINPHAYLTDVLTELVNDWPNRRLGELLPWSWTPEAS